MSYLLSKSRKDHPEKNGEVQKSPQKQRIGSTLVLKCTIYKKSKN